MDATEYSAVPRTDYPLTVITEEEYQPVAPSHPLVASQPWPSTHDSSKLLDLLRGLCR